MSSQPSTPTMSNAFGVSAPRAGAKPRRRMPGRTSFATFLILCRTLPPLLQDSLLTDRRSPATSFFLGILFSLFPYDYPILWSPPTSTSASAPPAVSPTPTSIAPATASILAAAAADPFATLERHLTLLHSAPPLIPRLLHIVVATGLLGFTIKLFKPTESNLLFDGASLALYVVAIVVYLSNVVKGLRAVSERVWDLPVAAVAQEVTQDGAWVAAKGTPVGRKDSLRVLCASNTILALVLVGVLVLQAGQWYAERKEGQELEEMEGEGQGNGRKARGGNAAAKKKN